MCLLELFNCFPRGLCSKHCQISYLGRLPFSRDLFLEAGLATYHGAAAITNPSDLTIHFQISDSIVNLKFSACFMYPYSFLYNTSCESNGIA